MNSEDPKKIGRIFREKFDRHEGAINHDSWKNISKSLDELDNKKPMPYLKYLIIPAVILSCIFVSTSISYLLLKDRIEAHNNINDNIETDSIRTHINLNDETTPSLQPITKVIIFDIAEQKSKDSLKVKSNEVGTKTIHNHKDTLNIGKIKSGTANTSNRQLAVTNNRNSLTRQRQNNTDIKQKEYYDKNTKDKSLLINPDQNNSVNDKSDVNKNSTDPGNEVKPIIGSVFNTKVDVDDSYIAPKNEDGLHSISSASEYSLITPKNNKAGDTLPSEILISKNVLDSIGNRKFSNDGLIIGLSDSVRSVSGQKNDSSAVSVINDSASISKISSVNSTEKLPDLKKDRSGKFVLGAEFSPGSSFRKLNSSNSSSTTIINERNTNEKAKLSYSFGISIGYKLSKRIIVSTGLQFISLGEKGKYFDDSLKISKPYSNSYNYICIPVLLGYKIGNPRFGALFTNGFAGADLLSATSNNKGDSYYNNNNSNSNDDNGRPIYSGFNILYLSNLEFNFYAHNRLSFQVGPSLKYFLTSIYSKSEMQKSKPYSIGIQFSAKYTF